MNALQNLVDYGVIGLLLALSVWTVAIAVERWLFYRRVDLTHYPNRLGLEMALTKHLVIIGTVAANAPYIGLMGTALGIILTFHTMGTSGPMAVNALMIGTGIVALLISDVAGPTLYNYLQGFSLITVMDLFLFGLTLAIAYGSAQTRASDI